jgi:shikimate kinase
MKLAYPDRNLIITGYTGPNQPLFGQQVADQLKMRYVNVDSQIELRAGVDLESLQTRYGETRLKMIEAEVMQEILLHRTTVIRVSGQTLLRAEYARRLMETGPLVCLVIRLDAALRRLHLALGGRYHDPRERAVAIGHLKREWAVRGLDGVRELDVTTLNDGEIIAALSAIWEETMAGVLVTALRA